MEFLLYLTPEAKQTLEQLYKTKVSVRENIHFCNKNSDLFGYADFNKKIIICTKNIKKSGYDTRYYVSQTLMHEAVHVAHFCNGLRPFGISKKDMPLSSDKLQSVRDSVKMSQATHQIEHEAHWMEKYPGKIKTVLEKYCL